MAIIRRRKKIVHIIHRLSIGGMEMVLVNMINEMLDDDVDHVIICLRGYDDFASRLTNPCVQVIDFAKRPGKDLSAYLRMYRLLKSLSADVVHSYNMAAMEYQLLAFFAGVEIRVHAEHGRDISDLDGSNLKYLILRRFLVRFLSDYVTVSSELFTWAKNKVGINNCHLLQINNGVDTKKYSPNGEPTTEFPLDENNLTFVTVGRFDPIKNQAWLIDCFAVLCSTDVSFSANARLLIVGEGHLESKLQEKIDGYGLSSQVKLVHSSSQVAELLRACDVFVLTSLAEGTPMTLLEAMASSLAVISTDVGGIPDVMLDGESGQLIKSGDSQALQGAMKSYFENRDLIEAHGEEGRKLIEAQYSLKKMTDQYRNLYGTTLQCKHVNRV